MTDRFARNRRDYLESLAPPSRPELTVPQAAARLGYKPDALRRRLNHGLIPPGFYRVGNQWRIREADLRALESGERGIGGADQPPWATRMELLIQAINRKLDALERGKEAGAA